MHPTTRRRTPRRQIATAAPGPSAAQLAELRAMRAELEERSAERTAVQNTIATLRYYQALRRAGVAVRLTTDPAWLVDTAINRRAGWPEDPHARVTVNAPRLWRKATGDAEADLRRIARAVNTPRLIVRLGELGSWRRYLARRLAHRLA